MDVFRPGVAIMVLPLTRRREDGGVGVSARLLALRALQLRDFRQLQTLE